MKSMKLLSCAILALASLSLPIQGNSAINNTGANSTNIRQYSGTSSYVPTNNHSWLNKKARPKAQEQEELVVEPFAVAASIFAAISIFGIFKFITLFTAPIGIILSIISLARLKKHPERWRGKKKAISALIMNAGALVLALGFFIYLLIYAFD